MKILLKVGGILVMPIEDQVPSTVLSLRIIGRKPIILTTGIVIQ
jgi:hypothetical protein